MDSESGLHGHNVNLFCDHKTSAMSGYIQFTHLFYCTLKEHQENRAFSIAPLNFWKIYCCFFGQDI